MRRQLFSWYVYTALIVVGVLVFYGPQWRNEWHVALLNAWQLRLIAIAAVLLVSVVSASLAGLLRGSVRLLRGVLAGALTGGTLHYLAGWVGDHYLGISAHSNPLNVGRLMSEGYGMMVDGIVTPGIGLLAWLRAEFGWWDAPRATQR